MKHENKKSFTLIELLLVVSILAMISLALFNTMANGLKIWERSRKFVVQEDVAIFFDKFSQDLRNCFLYSKIPFVGKANRIRFATRVKSLKNLEGDHWAEKMGEVEYYFDLTKKNLYLRRASYGQALRGEFDTERSLIKAIESVRFSYYYAQGNEIVLKDEADSLIPRAVGVEVQFWDGHTKQSLRKLINIPQGG